jgi:hypothetical protein
MSKLLLLAFAFGWMDIEYHEDKGLKPFFTPSSAILEEFSEANKVFFEGDLQAAKQKYLLISLRAYDANWDFSQRQIISHSLLRLCQLDRMQCEDYIRKVIFLDPDLIKHIDAQIFEPPLIQQSLLLRNQLERDLYQWQPNKTYENVKYFIVNGRIYNYSEGLQIPLPLTKQRIVVVYNNYQSEVYVGEVSEFLKWSPKGIKLDLDVAKTNLSVKPSLTKTESFTEESLQPNQWWKENKKHVILWSIAGGITAYFIHKNKKSSNEGGSVSSSSKE